MDLKEAYRIIARDFFLPSVIAIPYVAGSDARLLMVPMNHEIAERFLSGDDVTPDELVIGLSLAGLSMPKLIRGITHTAHGDGYTGESVGRKITALKSPNECLFLNTQMLIQLSRDGSIEVTLCDTSFESFAWYGPLGPRSPYDSYEALYAETSQKLITVMGPVGATIIRPRLNEIMNEALKELKDSPSSQQEAKHYLELFSSSLLQQVAQQDRVTLINRITSLTSTPHIHILCRGTPQVVSDDRLLAKLAEAYDRVDEYANEYGELSSARPQYLSDYLQSKYGEEYASLILDSLADLDKVRLSLQVARDTAFPVQRLSSFGRLSVMSLFTASKAMESAKPSVRLSSPEDLFRRSLKLLPHFGVFRQLHDYAEKWRNMLAERLGEKWYDTLTRLLRKHSLLLSLTPQERLAIYALKDLLRLDGTIKTSPTWDMATKDSYSVLTSFGNTFTLYSDRERTGGKIEPLLLFTGSAFENILSELKQELQKLEQEQEQEQEQKQKQKQKKKQEQRQEQEQIKKLIELLSEHVAELNVVTRLLLEARCVHVKSITSHHRAAVVSSSYDFLKEAVDAMQPYGMNLAALRPVGDMSSDVAAGLLKALSQDMRWLKDIAVFPAFCCGVLNVLSEHVVKEIDDFIDATNEVLEAVEESDEPSIGTLPILTGVLPESTARKFAEKSKFCVVNVPVGEDRVFTVFVPYVKKENTETVKFVESLLTNEEPAEEPAPMAVCHLYAPASYTEYTQKETVLLDPDRFFTGYYLPIACSILKSVSATESSMAKQYNVDEKGLLGKVLLSKPVLELEKLTSDYESLEEMYVPDPKIYLGPDSEVKVKISKMVNDGVYQPYVEAVYGKSLIKKLSQRQQEEEFTVKYDKSSGMLRFAELPLKIELTPERKEKLWEIVEEPLLLEHLNEADSLEVKTTYASVLTKDPVTGADTVHVGYTPVLVLTKMGATLTDIPGDPAAILESLLSDERKNEEESEQKLRSDVEPEAFAEAIKAFREHMERTVSKLGIQKEVEKVAEAEDFDGMKRLALQFADAVADKLKSILDVPSEEQTIEKALRQKLSELEIPSRVASSIAKNEAKQLAQMKSTGGIEEPLSSFTERFTEEIRKYIGGTSEEMTDSILHAVDEALAGREETLERFARGAANLLLFAAGVEKVQTAEDLKKLFVAAGWREYQFSEGWNIFLDWWKNGKAKALVGWEMRSGKTITGALSLFLTTLVERSRKGSGRAVFFARGANVDDVVSQLVEFLPMVLPNLYIVANEAGFEHHGRLFPVVNPEGTAESIPNLIQFQEFKRLLNATSQKEYREIADAFIGNVMLEAQRFRESLRKEGVDINSDEAERSVAAEIRESYPELLAGAFLLPIRADFRAGLVRACAKYIRDGKLNAESITSWNVVWQKALKVYEQIFNEVGNYDPDWFFAVATKNVLSRYVGSVPDDTLFNRPYGIKTTKTVQVEKLMEAPVENLLDVLTIDGVPVSNLYLMPLFAGNFAYFFVDYLGNYPSDYRKRMREGLVKGLAELLDEYLPDDCQPSQNEPLITILLKKREEATGELNASTDGIDGLTRKEFLEKLAGYWVDALVSRGNTFSTPAYVLERLCKELGEELEQNDFVPSKFIKYESPYSYDETGYIHSGRDEKNRWFMKLLQNTVDFYTLPSLKKAKVNKVFAEAQYNTEKAEKYAEKLKENGDVVGYITVKYFIPLLFDRCKERSTIKDFMLPFLNSTTGKTFSLDKIVNEEHSIGSVLQLSSAKVPCTELPSYIERIVNSSPLQKSQLKMALPVDTEVIPVTRKLSSEKVKRIAKDGMKAVARESFVFGRVVHQALNRNVFTEGNLSIQVKESTQRDGTNAFQIEIKLEMVPDSEILRTPWYEHRAFKNTPYLFTAEDASVSSLVIDEVDEVKDTTSSTYTVLHTLCRNASVAVGMTGTPANGYPESVVALFSMLEGTPLNYTRNTMASAERHFGVFTWKLETPQGATAFLLTAVMQKNPQLLKDFLISAVALTSQALLAKQRRRKRKANQNQEESTQQLSVETGKKLWELLEKAVSSAFNGTKTVDDFIKGHCDSLKKDLYDALFRHVRSIIKSYAENTGVPDPFEDEMTLHTVLHKFSNAPDAMVMGSVFKALSSAASKVPGTYEPIGFAKLIKTIAPTVRASFKTRESLKGTEEKKYLVDTFNPKVDGYEFVRNDAYSIKPAPNAVIHKLVSEVNKWKQGIGEVTSTGSIRLFLKELAEEVQSILGHDENLLKLFAKQAELTDIPFKELKNMFKVVHRSSKLLPSSNLCKLLDTGKPHVSPDEPLGRVTNGITGLLDAIVLRNMAVETYSRFKPVANRVVKKLPPELLEKAEVLHRVFRRTRWSAVIAPPGQRPSISHIRFGVQLQLVPELGNGTVIEVPVLPHIKHAAESVSNEGYAEVMRECIREKRNLVVAAPYHYSLLCAAYRIIKAIREEGDGSEVLFVRAPTLRMAKDIAKLARENSVTARITTTHSEFLRMLEEARSLVKEGRQVTILGGARHMSRGIDLSMCDRLLTFGAIPDPSEFSQLVARLFHVNKHEAEITAYGSAPHLPWATDAITALFKKDEFIRQLVAGKISSISSFERVGAFQKISDNSELELTGIEKR